MKRLLICLICLGMLAGCTRTKDAKAEYDAKYESHYIQLMENTRFSDASFYYTLNAERVQLDDGSYCYYITVDDPQVAMMDIVVIAVENNVAFQDSLNMMPSMGIYGEDHYHMVPFQVDLEKGFVKGITISGETTSEVSDIKFMITWNNYMRNKQYSEFIAFTLTDETPTYQTQKMTVVDTDDEEQATDEDTETEVEDNE